MVIKGGGGGPTSIGRCGNTSIQVFNVKAAVVLCKDYSYNSKFINSCISIGQSHREDQFDDEPSVKYFWILIFFLANDSSGRDFKFSPDTAEFCFGCSLFHSLAVQYMQCASVLQRA
jgi:hypothetical protein